MVKVSLRTGLLVALVLLVTDQSVADDLPTLKVDEVKPPAEIAEPIAGTLGPTSYLIQEEGKDLLRFWIRQSIPSSAAPGGMVGYDSLVDGELVGALEVKDDTFSDFRGQELHPGLYTLRIASHPQDGNHMGIAPSPVFLCLIPAGEDKSLDLIEREQLMELSKKAAKTGHPTALFLEPWFEAPQHPIPTVRQNELEHVVLDVQPKAKLESGEADFPIGIVFIGKTEAE